MSDKIEIDLINAYLPEQVLNMVKKIYQHEQTNEHTKHLIRFELQRILGRDTDIVDFLNGNEDLDEG